jgi:hypothetical protein
MTIPGQLIARAPTSPHANMRATTRAGTNKSGSAIWHLACSCGETITAAAPAIKKGAAKCQHCNPSTATDQAKHLLALLTCDYTVLQAKLKWSKSHVAYRVTAMREAGQMHIGKWKRPKAQGALQPIFHAGQGEDAPCTLTRRSDADYKRKYFKRVRRAIEKARDGAPQDGRYTRHVARYLAEQVALSTRAAPHNPWTALFQIQQEGAAC